MIKIYIQSVGTVEVLRVESYIGSWRQRVLVKTSDNQYVIWSIETDAEGLLYAFNGSYFYSRLSAEVEFDKRRTLTPA